MNDETKIVMEMALNHYEDIYGFEKSDITADGVKDFMEQIAEEAQEAGEADELFHYIMLSEKLRSRVDWQPIVKAVQEIFPESDDGFEDCECGYTHHYEDKCPKGENTKHYEKCKSDEEDCKCGSVKGKGDCAECQEDRDFANLPIAEYHAKYSNKVKEDDDDEEKEVWLDYSDFVENFEPKKDYSKIQEDDTIVIQTRPAESKNKARRESPEWCAFEWKHESEDKWKLMEYTGSSPFAMWWCQMIE